MTSPRWIQALNWLLWAALAATLTHWVLLLMRPPPEVITPAPAAPVQASPAASGPAAHLFGVSSTAPVAAPNLSIRLVGLMADASAGRGAALIAVEGRAPVAVRVGNPIGPAAHGLVLESVASDRITVMRGTERFELRLPARTSAVMVPGVLGGTSASGAGGAASPAGLSGPGATRGLTVGPQHGVTSQGHVSGQQAAASPPGMDAYGNPAAITPAITTGVDGAAADGAQAAVNPR